jgi:hypothetical protein
MGDEPTPAQAVEWAEQCQRLLDALPDETLRTVALYKIEGYTKSDIHSSYWVEPTGAF